MCDMSQTLDNSTERRRRSIFRSTPLRVIVLAVIAYVFMRGPLTSADIRLDTGDLEHLST